ncbi:hypothetical protein F5051DRAFT_421681 [Lentinula edodes]|nr:hypothetical protein F5051DRAFT_421681 [Lentinula edodes]
MPTHDAWAKYRKWRNEYGGLIYVSSANTLIINKAEVAIDLLEKRARIYSDRTVTPIMKLCGADLNLALEPYSDRWRRDRRLFQQVFRQATISRFYPAQHSKINEFLRELLSAPDDFMDHTMACVKNNSSEKSKRLCTDILSFYQAFTKTCILCTLWT